MANLAKQFGLGVRSRRRAKGLTQAQLGEASGLSEEWLRRIERGAGAPSFETLEALAAALSCGVGELFSPITPREMIGSRVGALLADVPDDELDWLEALIRVALRHPSR